ncbi:MAG: N-formylglutamate amidohydrolase [Pseudomonadota bacterium]
MTYKPIEVEGADRPSRWLVTCDHARNTVPDFVGGGCLGLADADMQRHIAYDPGARGVALALANLLDGTYIGSNFSRLVIDPNRGEDDPTLVMQLYDGTIIPANRVMDTASIKQRLELCYRPYHTTLAKHAARQENTILISVHSFTPQLRGRAPRPWQIGVLFSSDERLSRPVIDLLNAQGDLCIGENEPYTGALRGDALDTHAVRTKRAHALLEFRNDLIQTPRQQIAWAERVAPILLEASEKSNV